MTVYLASRYSRKNELREYARQAREHGITVGTRWLDEPHDPNSNINDISVGLLQEYAAKDYSDISNCDVFVFFSEDPLIGTPRGGRHTEFGIALTRYKKIVVIGEPENIFHYLPGLDIEFFPNWNSALCHLRTLNGEE